MFVQSIFDFTIIALAIFVAIKLMKKLQDKEAGKESRETKGCIRRGFTTSRD
jgi:large-conductance mechanosensitive channel